MECYTYLRNVTDLFSDEKTPYERRFGKPFGGPVIPFGSLVEYYESIYLLIGKPLSGNMWSVERPTKRQVISRQDHSWPELWRGIPRNFKLREK